MNHSHMWFNMDHYYLSSVSSILISLILHLSHQIHVPFCLQSRYWQWCFHCSTFFLLLLLFSPDLFVSLVTGVDIIAYLGRKSNLFVSSLLVKYFILHFCFLFFLLIFVVSSKIFLWMWVRCYNCE